MACAARFLLAQSLMCAQRLDQRVAHRKERVQTGHRLLKDHRDLRPTPPPHLGFRQRKQVLTVQSHFTGNDTSGRGDQAQYGKAGDALAASGLTDQAQGLPRFDLEVNAVYGRNHALFGKKLGLQTAHSEQRHAAGLI